MARADSKIVVSIIGDASKLSSSLGEAERKVGGFQVGLGTLAKGFVALGVASAGVDFIKGATQEADRLGDALARLTHTLGPEFTAQLDSAAGGFAEIGASKQDILELEAVFADFGHASGIANDALATLAPTAAATAQALTLTDDQGRSASQMLDLLDKAATGSEKAARELGVTLTDGLDPAAQMTSILAQLSDKVTDAESSQKDLEGQQSKLQAQWETLTGQLGGPLSDALASVVGFINDEIDAIPGAIKGWEMLGAAVEGFGRTALAPLGNVRDALEGLSNLLGDVAFNLTHIGSGAVSERTIRQANEDFNNRQGRAD
jgi:uncharacterized phage infection (PIP) family protein YhgE